ncbi:MAG TPA: ABC transporter ATP-binding protein [Paracoccaceae bacterium]|nr:ABC transporter ATP-binding protein [Paracoccaceae bacterium]
MAELVVRDLVRTFGDFRAVDDVSFTVADGEFLTLLGPSGCGKSTTLSALAGLDRPEGGRIALGDRVFFDSGAGVYVPAEKRDIGLVFQSYALWPHMTVRANLEFPLKLRKVPRAERRRRIEETLDLVEMGPYADRYPHALSGGQQQRVALARTLVYRPSLLLLDEPLSNLDAKLRERARTWLRHLQSQVQVTTVYVTHDQSEALALSDRIAVMNKGRIAQLADPYTIYERPADPFVADFIGSSNFFSGVMRGTENGEAMIELEGGQMLRASMVRDVEVGRRVAVAVRPERIELLAASQAELRPVDNVFEVEVLERMFLGSTHSLQVRAGASQFRVEHQGQVPDGAVFVAIPSEACIVFEAPADSVSARPAA